MQPFHNFPLKSISISIVETMSPVGYGAVNVHDEFDEKNTYYLNESRCNWNRFFRAVVPVVIALVIMGGFAYGMSHG